MNFPSPVAMWNVGIALLLTSPWIFYFIFPSWWMLMIAFFSSFVWNVSLAIILWYFTPQIEMMARAGLETFFKKSKKVKV